MVGEQFHRPQSSGVRGGGEKGFKAGLLMGDTTIGGDCE
jgi:hypothetical protein